MLLTPGWNSALKVYQQNNNFLFTTIVHSPSRRHDKMYAYPSCVYNRISFGVYFISKPPTHVEFNGRLAGSAFDVIG